MEELSDWRPERCTQTQQGAQSETRSALIRSQNHWIVTRAIFQLCNHRHMQNSSVPPVRTASTSTTFESYLIMLCYLGEEAFSGTASIQESLPKQGHKLLSLQTPAFHLVRAFPIPATKPICLPGFWKGKTLAINHRNRKAGNASSTPKAFHLISWYHAHYF